MENAQALTPRAKPTLDTREGVAWGVLRLLFAFFFGNRVAKILTELESLFDAWKSGTLPPIPAPRPSKPGIAPTTRARQRHTYVRRSRPVARILLRDVHPARAKLWATITRRFATTPPPKPTFIQKSRFSRRETHAHFITFS